MRGLAAIALLAAAMAAARPVVDRTGIRNAASLLPAGLPGGGLAPLSLFVVRGRQMGPEFQVTAAQPSEELGGVTVEIAVAKHTWKAVLFAAGTAEIRGMIPAGVAYGPATVTVKYQGQSSDPVQTRVVPASVGLFSISRNGTGPAVALAVKRGDRVTLPVAGLGEDPRAAKLELFVGGLPAANVKAENSPECCGVGHVSFDVPKTASPGCSVPIQVRTNGSALSNVVTITIETESTFCTREDNIRFGVGLSGRVGFAIPFRLTVFQELSPGEGHRLQGDALVAGFREGTVGDQLGPVLHPPPEGSCTVYTTSSTPAEMRQAASGDLMRSTTILDGGAWRVAMPGGGAKTVAPAPIRDDYEFGVLGGSFSAENRVEQDSASPLFLRPGLVNVGATGGADIGSFGLRVRFPNPLTWTNREQTDVVNRGRELEVRWSGETADQLVAVAGVNIDKPGGATAGFLCLAKRGEHRFRVPVPILQSLPVSRTQWDDSLGYIMLGTLPDTDVFFSVPGTDEFLGIGAAFDGRTVRFR
ncbi:MAG: hypothetical protein ABI811_04585 [Acidobacteriota bacterium]